MEHKAKWLFFFLGFFSLLHAPVCFSAEATPTTNNDTHSLAKLLKNILPAVVNIRAQIKITDPVLLSRLQNANPGQVPDKFLSIGSGVIVEAEKGYILTNAHVVNDAESVIVTLSDGHHYRAKIIGVDKPSDIALLQIKAKGLTALAIGNSNDLQVGDSVAAIGNPFGLKQTVTRGIVSGLGRGIGIENYENFIQTDAPINPGNSGGALVNMNGELIGINTAILAPSSGSIGIGFAIPSNMFKTVMLQIIAYGNVKRGTLGVGAQDITPDLATAFNVNINKGAAITLVVPDSPAEKAGLQTGDIIVAINGSEIKNSNDVVNTIGLIRVDSKADITVLRNNKKLNLSAVLLDPKKRQENSQAKNPFLYGVGLKEFTLLSPIHGDIKGILVVSVEEDSYAWRSDLRPGDVITTANQQKVTTITELQKIAAASKNNLLLNVLRGSSAVFLILSTDS